MPSYFGLTARALRLLYVLLASVAALCAQTSLPPGEGSLLPEGVSAFEFRLMPHAGENGRFEPIEVPGASFKQAFRVSTLKDSGPEFAIELRGGTTREVSEGDVGLLRFFVRATEISDETGTAHIAVAIRGDRFDGPPSFEGDFPVVKEWQEVLVPFVWKRSYAKGHAFFLFQFGYKRQTVEVGGVEAIHYGRSRDLASLPRTRFSYEGREADAPWRTEALARIEKLRKGDFSIEVVGADGKPLPAAQVTVKQTRSAFQWGTALQMRRIVEDSPDNRRYREVTQEFFNAATTENDLKWPAWDGEWVNQPYSKEQTLAGLRWLKERRFHLRGHVLVWPGQHNLPKSVLERLGTPREKEVPQWVVEHIRSQLRETKGLLDEWDVLNEPFTNHTLMDTFGEQIMPTWFVAAREELPPTVPLYLNDFSNHDATTDGAHVAHFEKTARYLLDHGAPLGGLGIQAHFNGRPNAPKNILAVFDRYASQFHLPLRITEFDVWTYDEELQADFTRDFLILAFSHPSVVGIQHWGFWESAHWRPSAGMFRKDWSEKPNAKVYREWVLKAWRTNLEGATDKDGHFARRGFYGDYEVVVESGGKRASATFSLEAGAPAPRLRFALP